MEIPMKTVGANLGRQAAPTVYTGIPIWFWGGLPVQSHYDGHIYSISLPI